MNKTTTQFKCSNCEKGVVQLIAIDTKNAVSYRAVSCNSCGKSYGLKAISKLTEI